MSDEKYNQLDVSSYLVNFAGPAGFGPEFSALDRESRQGPFRFDQPQASGNGGGPPEDKYDFRLKPEMRTFGAVIVHVASGNVYAAKAGRGENVNWDELDPNDYKTKAAVVALLKKSIADTDATLKALPDDSFAKTVEPWIGVLEHSAEHYGLLVAYYRANGLTPPASRPKK